MATPIARFEAWRPFSRAAGERASRRADRATDLSAASLAMERYADGDDTAFEPLYRALAPDLRRYFLLETRSDERACDLLGKTMLQLHLTRSRFLRGADVLPWARAIARRVLLDDVRRAPKDR